MTTVTGNYGSVQCEGAEGSSGSWRGFSIGGRHVFMDDGANSCGIYNDTENAWLIHCTDQSYVRLYYNGSAKMETTNTGIAGTGAITVNSLSVPSWGTSGQTSDNITIGTGAAIGGSNGDIHFRYTP